MSYEPENTSKYVSENLDNGCADAFSCSKLQTTTRRLLAVPSSNGAYVLLSDITYDHTSHEELIITRINMTQTGISFYLPGRQSLISPFWLHDSSLVWGEMYGNQTRLWCFDMNASTKRPQEVGFLDGCVTQLKAQSLPNNQFALIYSSNNTISRKDIPVTGSGKLYNTLPVRFSKLYRPAHPTQSSIYWTIVSTNYGILQLSRDAPIDLLKDIHLNSKTWPHGHEFAVGPSGLLFAAAPKQIDPYSSLGGELYYLEISWQTAQVTGSPERLGYEAWTGAPSSFTFSPDGCRVMFLQSERLDACFSHDSIFIVDLRRLIHASRVTLRPTIPSVTSAQTWSPRILSTHWDSSDSDVLYAIIDEMGYKSLWRIQIGSEQLSGNFEGVTSLILRDGSISFSCSLNSTASQAKLFLLRSTFYRTGIVEFLTLEADVPPHLHLVEECTVSFATGTHEQVFFTGSGGSAVHAFIHKPKDFDSTSQYPVIIVVHGGPNDAWRDEWSSVWNPLLWTDQGYVVITPNVAGSTGFGLPFALSIYKGWGDRPLIDLECLFSFMESSLHYVDFSRVVGAGYSFGGYLMNWVAGHNISKRFCALIVHGGVFSVPNLLGGDLPVAYRADFGSFPWEDDEEWSKWSPSRFCSRWTTPMLFTHGDIDYRVPITESLAAYHACQIMGVPSQLLVFPDEGHTLSKPKNIIQWHEVMFNWAAKWHAVGNSQPRNGV